MRGARLLCLLCFCAASPSALGRTTGAGPGPGAGARLGAGREPPLPAGQCRVYGMTMFEGAMWSPEPCTVCQCQRDMVKCKPTPCDPGPAAGKVDVVKEITERKGVGGGPGRSGSMISSSRGQAVRTKGQTRAAVAPVSPGPAVRAPAAPRTRRPHNSSDEEDRDSSDEDEDAEHEDVVGPPPPPPPKAKVDPQTPSPSVLRTAPPRPPPRGAGPGQPRRPAPEPPAGGRPVVVFPQKPPFMESLPPGCLLSETLVACGGTGLTRMPLLSDRGVKTLYLADNKISRIPAKALAGLPNLEWLDLSKNKLDDASFSPLLFQNLTRLRRLILDGNNLTKLPAFLPPSLLELKINDNKLSGLTPSSFKGLSKLLTLELEDNHFHDGNVSPLTFRPLRKLAYLRLDDNRFRGIPSGLPVSLQELHLSDNKIEVVQAGILNKTANLRVLDLSHNRIREDRIAPHALIHLLKLESLDLSHNRLVHVPSFLPPGVRQLVLHHNLIRLIPAFVFGHLAPGLDSLYLSHNRLRDDGLGQASFLGLSSSLAELLLDHNLLHSVPRGLLQLRGLQHLRLNHNLISDVPLGALCDPGAREDSPLLSVHLENNLIQRHLIPPSAFSCIRSYHSVLLRPQRHEE